MSDSRFPTPTTELKLSCYERVCHERAVHLQMCENGFKAISKKRFKSTQTKAKNTVIAAFSLALIPQIALKKLLAHRICQHPRMAQLLKSPHVEQPVYEAWSEP